MATYITGDIFPYFGGTMANKLLSEENLSTITRSFGLGSCGYLDYTEDAEGEEQEIKPFYVTCNPIEITYQNTNVTFTITKGKGQINGYQIETKELSSSTIQGIFLEGNYLCLKLSSPTNGRLKAISEMGSATNIEFVKVDWGASKKKEKRDLLPLAKLVKNSSGKLEPLYICPTSAMPNITTDGTTASQASFTSNGINLYSDNDFSNYRASIGKSKIDIKNIGSMSTLVDDNIELKAKRSDGTAYSRLYVDRGIAELLSTGDSGETRGKLSVGATMMLQSKTDLSVSVGDLNYLYLDSGTDGAIFGVNNKPTTIYGNSISINGTQGGSIKMSTSDGLKLSSLSSLAYIKLDGDNATIIANNTNGVAAMNGSVAKLTSNNGSYGFFTNYLGSGEIVSPLLFKIKSNDIAMYNDSGDTLRVDINDSAIQLLKPTSITGATNIAGNTTITGNESVTGDITVSGNATIGDSNKQVAINGAKININSNRTTNNTTSIGSESQVTWIEATSTIHIQKDKDNKIQISSSGVSVSGDSVNINGSPLADFVVEQGTKTVEGLEWKYRKWESGRYEAWGQQTKANLSYTSAGSIYIGAQWDIPMPFTSTENKPIKYFGLTSCEGTAGATCMGWAITYNNHHAYVRPWSYIEKAGVTLTATFYVVYEGIT